ncbi:MAG: alpha/beta hydrolase, partial [Chloroflexi bacterium]|nr:alpha/beta hydrolase [Chloroflexota bacterium]
YQSRALFRRWHPAALDAYLAHGLRPRPDREGVELAYDPAWEAAIFARVPVDVWAWIRRAARQGLPAVILYGEHSEIYRPAVLRRLRRAWPAARLVRIPGHGHMFPMEAPAATARAIAATLPSDTPPKRV